MQISFHFAADPCFHYKNLSDANRKITYITPHGSELCDNQLSEDLYRFVGDAGTKMPTTRVPAHRCGTGWSGWLDGAHPTVEDGKVRRTVCFSDRFTDCRFSATISVKNCGSYFIYKLQKPPSCPSRYCSKDWIWSKCAWRSKRTHKSLRSYVYKVLTCDLFNFSSLSSTLSAVFNFGGKQVFISLEWWFSSDSLCHWRENCPKNL